MVLLYHFFPYYKWLSFGWMGVDLFFVLSGLLITGILIDTKDFPNYYSNYLAKRVLRIFPLYYFFLFSFFIGSEIFRITGSIPNFSYLGENQIWYWSYLQNWLILFDSSYPEQNFLSHFWSLAIEEQFYIFWPLIIYTVPKNKLVAVCMIFIAASISLRLTFYFYGISPVKAYVFTFTRLDGLCLGSAVAAMLRDHFFLKYLNRYTLKVFISLVLLLVCMVATSRSLSFVHPLYATIGYTLIDLFFASIILISLSDGSNLLKQITQSSVLAFFGRYSYGLYVYHIPVYRFFSGYLRRELTTNEILISVLCLLFSVLISMFSFHLMEKHFLKLKSRFENLQKVVKEDTTTA